MITPAAIAPAPGSALPLGAGQAAADANEDLTFGDVLSALNPLQYLPVIGTIYRAITGDIPPAGARIAGNLAAGALMGGPFGFALSILGTIAQKVTCIDLDSLAHDAMVAVGIIDDPATPHPVIAASDAGAAAHLLLPGGGSQPEFPVSTDPVRRDVAFAAYDRTLYGASGRLGPV